MQGAACPEVEQRIIGLAPEVMAVHIVIWDEETSFRAAWYRGLHGWTTRRRYRQRSVPTRLPMYWCAFCVRCTGCQVLSICVLFLIAVDTSPQLQWGGVHDSRSSCRHLVKYQVAHLLPLRGRVLCVRNRPCLGGLLRLVGGNCCCWTAWMWRLTACRSLRRRRIGSQAPNGHHNRGVNRGRLVCIPIHELL